MMTISHFLISTEINMDYVKKKICSEDITSYEVSISVLAWKIGYRLIGIGLLKFL